MDFLDPRKRRSDKIRLLVGYFLIGIAIALATTILVYITYGYGISTKTGQIIENGLLYVDSRPGGASIYLNGQLQSSRTSARLVLSSGDYSLSIKKDGYRSWQRNFVLSEHAVTRYTYPFLFPTKPQVTDLKSYSGLPGLATESPDRHWLLIEEPSPATSIVTLDEYDTSNLAAGGQALSIPAALLSNDTSVAPILKIVEWSTDNKHLLLQHNFDGGYEFIVVDRTDTAKSFNVNQVFKINPTQVAMRNKKVDQLYIYDQAKATLQVADTTQKILTPAFLNRVLAFKPYGDTLLTYVTDSGMAAGQVQARIWDNGKTYALYNFAAGDTYIIDAAQFQSHWYYLAGSDKASRINIYEDPLASIQNPSIAKAVPFFGFSIPGASKASFSDSARFIGIEANQNFAVYDLENQIPYRYTVKQPLAQAVTWMDGDRWIGQTGSNVFVLDYDNTNTQLVTPTVFPAGGFFSADYNQMITFAPSSDGTSVSLQRVDMRAGSDLPKNGAQ